MNNHTCNEEYLNYFTLCNTNTKLLLLITTDSEFITAAKEWFSNVNLTIISTLDLDIINEANIKLFDTIIIRMTVDAMLNFNEILGSIIRYLEYEGHLIIGVMSASVFRNGLTLSKTVEKLAAFDIQVEMNSFIKDPQLPWLIPTPDAECCDNAWESVALEIIVRGTKKLVKDLCETNLYNFRLLGCSNNAEIESSEKVSIIVLTYNKLSYTKQCIESIVRHTDVPYELIIVDNKSNDGTLSYLEEFQSLHSHITIIPNPENYGYAGGNNIGISNATGDFVLVLNNDTVVTPGYLSRMVHHLRKIPNVGIVGPCSNAVTTPQKIHNAAYKNIDDLERFASIYSHIYYDQTFISRRLVGYCLLIKKEVIDRIGGFDPRFSRGNYEDDDFCLRTNIAGFTTIVARDVFVHHYEKTSWENANLWSYYMLRNWEIFKDKWELNKSRSINSKYPIESLCNQVYNWERHYMPVVARNDPIEYAIWGRRMFEKRMLLQAKASFLLVLKKNPGNIEAQYYLNEIENLIKEKLHAF